MLSETLSFICNMMAIVTLPPLQGNGDINTSMQNPGFLLSPLLRKRMYYKCLASVSRVGRVADL